MCGQLFRLTFLPKIVLVFALLVVLLSGRAFSSIVFVSEGERIQDAVELFQQATL